MAPHDHLLDKFDPSHETKEAARTLIRQVQLKTGRGSGHELGSLTVGIPAACMQIASERLNNTDVSKGVAQGASCLSRKDYDKVYTIIKNLLEENEGEGLSYQQLQIKYAIPTFESQLKPYITRIENELITGLDMNHHSDAFKGIVFFWICSSAQFRTLTDTQKFSYEHRLPLKKFVDALSHLNKSCAGLQQEIHARFSGKSSPAKGSGNIAPTRQSPRKTNNAASILQPTTEVEPVRRSLRSAVAQDTTLRISPVKRTPQTSPTKIAQPKSFRGFPQVKTQRELPNRDSPKKRAVESKPEQQQEEEEEEEEETGMEIDSTTMESPTKKRKTDTTGTLVPRPSSPASRPRTRQTNVGATVLSSPSKTNQTMPKTVPSPFPRTPTRKMVLQAPKDDTESSSDENGPELGLSIRRHRPVYLDHRQWNARDPRLDKIWRKADKARKKTPTGKRFEDNDIMMDD